MSTVVEATTDIVPRIEAAAAKMARAKQAVGKIVFGQEHVIERVLVTLMSGGHGLLIGVPGTAKTLMVETFGKVLGLDAKRIQFTPDLMPSDIVGSEVLEEAQGAGGGRRSFRFIKGPIFGQLLMADEINRASPRTQSALLQAMQEGRVSIGGVEHKLDAPFHVLATQNPIEQEGTYPLPEAQLDRFLLQIDVGYPDEKQERAMLHATTGAHDVQAEPEPGYSAERLMNDRALVRQVPVPPDVVDAILALVRGGRPETPDNPNKLIGRFVAWGPGPRAAQALMLAVRARALLQGRICPSTEDVYRLAHPVLRHRMALNFAARAEGIVLNDLIDRLAEPWRPIAPR